MRTPSDIVIEHKLCSETRTTKFHVSVPVKAPTLYGYVLELHERFTFPRLAELIAWLDQHDYRYVCASRGHWRLP
jgi:hypothetical protein